MPAGTGDATGGASVGNSISLSLRGQHGLSRPNSSDWAAGGVDGTMGGSAVGALGRWNATVARMRSGPIFLRGLWFMRRLRE